MKASDVSAFAFSSMVQHKGRTTLNLLGVIVGTFALALSLAIGAGIETAVLRQFRKDDALRKIEVHASYSNDKKKVPPGSIHVDGEMSESRRKRLYDALVRRWLDDHVMGETVPLTREIVRGFEHSAHVAEVLPVTNFRFRASLADEGLDVTAASVAPGDHPVEGRVVLGRAFDSRASNGVIVNEVLLYQWGFHDESSAAKALGRKVRVGGSWKQDDERLASWYLTRQEMMGTVISPGERSAFFRTLAKLPDLIKHSALEPAERELLNELIDSTFPVVSAKREAAPTMELPIVAVVRELDPKDKDGTWGSNRMARFSEVLLPVDLAAKLQRDEPLNVKHAYDQVLVVVDSEENVEGVEKRIKEQGFGTFSLVEVIRNVRALVFLITTTMGLIAIVALLVASLGITNTMIMSVLERTREIGILKSVGARDRDVMAVFLVEGGLVGAIGAGTGVLLSRLAAYPGNAIIRGVVPPSVELPPNDTLFRYSSGMLIGVPLVVVAITTLAALLPAIRASRLDPVRSLRHD